MGMNILSIMVVVGRISNSMDSIRKQLKYDGSLGEFLTYLTTDKEFRFKSKEDMIDNYKQMQKEVDEKIMPKLFEQKVSHKCEIVPVPEEQQDTASAAYYIEGDLKGKRKGKFYLNVGEAKKSNNFDVESLYLHEAMPGHHYQLTLVNDSDLPLFIKSMQNTSYVEGWALYCENLGEYRDPISYMGKLNLEMLRAIRLVVDTGIHHYGWTYNQCRTYFIKHSLLPEHEINSEIERYIVLPGQALAYKIGEFSFNEIKEYYLEQKKSLKEFHKDVLQFGALPLEMLENILMG